MGYLDPSVGSFFIFFRLLCDNPFAYLFGVSHGHHLLVSYRFLMSLISPVTFKSSFDVKELHSITAQDKPLVRLADVKAPDIFNAL